MKRIETKPKVLLPSLSLSLSVRSTSLLDSFVLFVLSFFSFVLGFCGYSPPACGQHILQYVTKSKALIDRLASTDWSVPLHKAYGIQQRENQYLSCTSIIYSRRVQQYSNYIRPQDNTHAVHTRCGARQKYLRQHHNYYEYCFDFFAPSGERCRRD